MLQRYEDLGYSFENITELIELLNEYEDDAVYYDSLDKATNCILLQPDRNSRFWYYKRKDEEFISGLDLHYKASTSFWARNMSWAASKSEPRVRDANGRLTPVIIQSRPLIATGGKGTTFCVNMVEAPLMGPITPACRFNLAVTAFCEEARVFTGENDESFIPLGMFSADGEAEVPRATMTATINSSSVQFNFNTGKFFHEILVSCLGMEFTVVASAASLNGYPRNGNRISGNFWLSGTVKEAIYK